MFRNNSIFAEPATYSTRVQEDLVKIKNFLPLQMGLELQCSISFRQPSVGTVLARPRFEDGARG
jgi:hypothetical protein